jgi:ribosomal protein S18 acetylase RimI-like enzyme
VRRANSDFVPDLENLRRAERTLGGRHVLARLDGAVAGGATSYTFPSTPEVLQVDVTVLPDFRRRGIGEALFRELSARARELGKAELQVEVREDDEQSIRFAERRGFRELERQKAVVLYVGALAAPPAVEAPSGVEILSRGERPDLERELYELDQAAGRDIPGLDSEGDWSFEEWREFVIERPGADPDLSFVAIAGDEVVGSASMLVIGGIAYHGLTAVAREWRGRGIATALKHAQIAAAHSRGLTRLVTESQHDNLPMRRLNEKLGYVAEPGTIVFRGPLRV